MPALTRERAALAARLESAAARTEELDRQLAQVWLALCTTLFCQFLSLFWHFSRLYF
jgi:hypothetical protein